MEDQKELLLSLEQELRRGTIVLGVLCRLDTPMYGYNLVEELSKHGLDVEANTLYPLLRRLESQGLLESRWETEGNKPRKYYSRTEAGKEIYIALRKQWLELSTGMSRLFEAAEKK
jgi:PadR family transcriptional regulator, regulatory protein PadR